MSVLPLPDQRVDHPRLPANEPQRLAALRRFHVLDTPPEWSFDRVTRLAAQLFQVPLAAVSLVDEHRQWFKSQLGLAFPQQTLRCDSFCAHAILTDDIFVVSDADLDPRFHRNPFVTGEPRIRFYAGAPLHTGEDIRLGTLCVVDVVPREFTPMDARVLAALAGTVVDELALRLSAQDALTESEGRFRQLVEQAADSFFVCGLDGRLTDVNQAAGEALGYTRDELLRLNVAEIEITGSAQTSFEHWRHSPPAGAESVAGRFRRKDGTTFPVEARVSYLWRDGRALILALVRDMTERQEAETRLRQAKEEAEHANAAKNEFLGRMSHELRTPLNAVLGFSRLLHQRLLAPKDQECVSHILKGGQRLLELIDKLLDVSRLETGSLEMSIESVSLRDLVRACVEAVRPLGLPRQIVIGVSSEDAPPLLVRADSQRLKQVVLHLLSNAVKFNAEGTGVAVDYYAVGEQVRLCVHDHGPGIAPGQIERLFKPFERLTTGDAGLPGTGLGLVLCKHLVEALGGTIGVESKVGHGSLFWVQLPAAEPIEADFAPGPDTTFKSAATAAETAPTVLYIDDDESNLKLVEYLVRADRKVLLLTALRGASGIELARARRPDLILLDLHLPDLSGDEVLCQLRADAATRDIPVVTISGNISPEKIAQLTSAGVQNYLTKPIDIQQVRALLSTVTRRALAAAA